MVFGNLDWRGASLAVDDGPSRHAKPNSCRHRSTRNAAASTLSPYLATMLWVPPRHAQILRLLAALFVAAPRLSAAQSRDPKPLPNESRAQLIAKARSADSLGRKQEAFLLQKRLTDGDFEVGARIIATYEGLGLNRQNETLTVQTGKILKLGDQMGDLSVTGMLRFELYDSVAARVAKYYRNEVVHVIPLVRLSLAGAVRAPGSHYARGDTPLSDFITRTGSPDGSADLSNVIINRGQQPLWGKQDVQSALADGLTIDGLALEPGDEIVVGARSQGNRWITVLQVGVPLVALLVTLLVKR